MKKQLYKKKSKLNRQNIAEPAITKKLLLNGPTNYFKLKNNDREIYIFFDNHSPIISQHNCDNYDSKDFDKYIYKILKSNKNKTIIDFFLEINPTSIPLRDKYYYNGNYLQNMRKVFKKLYSELYEDIKEDDKPKQDIRLHYMDIRDYAFFNDLIYKMNIIFELHNKEQHTDLLSIQYELKIINESLIFIESIIESIITNKKLPAFELYSNTSIDYINIKPLNSKNNMNINELMDIGLYQIINKILNNKIIKDFFMKHYFETSKYLIKKITELSNYIEEKYKLIDAYKIKSQLTLHEINKDQKNSKYSGYDKIPYYDFNHKIKMDIYRKISDELVPIDILIGKLGVIITDCYLLRRLINNDKIKKAIIYTGGYHSTIYVWFLLKYLDYSIEEYNYLKDNININKLIDIAKNGDYFDIMEYIIPNNLNQCVEINEI